MLEFSEDNDPYCSYTANVVYIYFEVDIQLASLGLIEPDPSSLLAYDLSVSIPFSPLDPGWETSLPMASDEDEGVFEEGLDAINSKEWKRSSIYMSSYQTVENLCNHSVPMISSLAAAEFAMSNITRNMDETS
ncbi:hypothetical protein C1H46_018211 [Malus baccata]|uniref:Uncharacterized protein n=1 Tax=Malus baccata TaxID=106549 RepID=A0A540MC86_MALBA|nr:hypothetical protein C1H46_018211 [Malus baccata]